MRITVTAVALIVCASVATAEAQRPAAINVSAELDDMVVYHDGKGHYLASWSDGNIKHRYFYGNGRRFFEMGVFASSKRKSGRWTQFIDPRVVEASLTFDGPTGTARCRRTMDAGNETKTKLTRLAADDQKKLLKRAKFFGPPFQRMPHALARDAMGIYYYVDHLIRPKRIGVRRDYRLYVGSAGAMKRVKLTTVASDSIGQVFATKKGALQVRWGRKRNRTRAIAFAWIQPNRTDKIELTNVPADINERVIFNQLQVYGAVRLGTHCDDL